MSCLNNGYKHYDFLDLTKEDYTYLSSEFCPYCTPESNVGFKLILMMIGLSLLGIILFFMFRDGFDSITMEKLIITFILLIFGIITYQISSQNLGTQCPIS